MSTGKLCHQGCFPREHRTAFCLLLMLSMGAMISPAAFGLDEPYNRETLRGLQGVYVLVEKIIPEAQRHGLTNNQVQTDVELRLRKAGIRVLTQQEALATPGVPYLYVNINALPEPEIGGVSGLYSFLIEVAFNQKVFLSRDVGITIPGIATWDVNTMGTIGRNNIRQLQDTVADLVDRFINAYLSVNPEQAGRIVPHQHIRPSFQGSLIRQVQECLAEKGFDPGPRDGQMGAKTEAALRQFQRGYGIPIPGELDAATRTALGIE